MRHVGDLDWGLPEEKKWCYMSLGVSGSDTSSEQSSASGVNRENRDRATDQLFSLINATLPQVQAFGQSPPRLNLDPNTGLTVPQQNLANNLVASGVKNQFNQLSAGGALRGQTHVANTSAILGSAAERAAASVLPQALDISGQNQQFNALSPQQTQSQAFQFIQGLGGLLAALTQGSEGQSQGMGNSFGFNFGYGTGSTGGGTSTR